MRFCVIFILLVSSLACENDLNEIDKVIDKKAILIETASDVELLYSDSAVVRVKLKAPLMYRHLDNNKPRSEFPNGVRVDFFGPNKESQGYMTAKHALRFDDTQEVQARDSVVWTNGQGEELRTSELIWDEKNQKVH